MSGPNAILAGRPSGGAPSRPFRVLHALPDLAMGGGQQVLLRNIRYMDRHLFVHHVVYFRPCHDMAPLFAEQGVEPLFLHHRGFWDWPGLVRRMVRLVRHEGIDLIHIQGAPIEKDYAQLAARICRTPVVRTLHGMMPPAPSILAALRRPGLGRLLRTGRALARRAVDRALDPRTVRRVVAVSDTVLESWRPYLDACGFASEQIRVSYNGVPVEHYASPQTPEVLARLKSDLRLDGAYPVLISVGRLSAGKDQKSLLAMMPHVLQRWSGARLLLVGEGEDRPAIERMRRDAGLESQILLLGRRTDTAALLAVSDLFVFASRFEGFPLAVLEALSAARPVVAFTLPALPAIVQNGVDGQLVEDRTPEALARAVIEVCADPARARVMGLAGQRLMRERYDIGAPVRALEEVYLSVLESRGSVPGLGSAGLATP